ncbi:MAG: GNAT family N-acetyltransferase [Ignavibacteria bacterium]|jgi:GNAT superfamily N-acetyltransferase|nr:GNAT family N-acetyltransferase [Ignavibacteria bacterium]
MIKITRTNSDNPDFHKLIEGLNKDLWNMNYSNQGHYDKHNIIENLPTVVVAYDNETVIGCGCFKKFDDTSAEVKRMYIAPSHRRKGISKMILNELEIWAKEEGYAKTILETGTAQTEAIGLYKNSGYTVIENYGPYAGLPESICMKKNF